jgi:hypothetical protein
MFKERNILATLFRFIIKRSKRKHDNKTFQEGTFLFKMCFDMFFSLFSKSLTVNDNKKNYNK